MFDIALDLQTAKARAADNFNQVDGLGYRLGRWYQKGRARRLYLGTSSNVMFILYQRRSDVSKHLISGVEIIEGTKWFDCAELVSEKEVGK